MSEYHDYEDDTNRKPLPGIHIPDESEPGVPAAFYAAKELTFAGLRDVNVARCEDVFHPLNDWTLTDWATALAGEVGEACNIVKKLRRLQGADAALNTPQYYAELVLALRGELADVAIYLDLLSAACGGDLGADIIAKFNLVSQQCRSRYYL